MSTKLAVYFFLKSEYMKDCDKWFTVRDVAKVIDRSVDRTRCHLSLLVFSGDIRTRLDGWKNVYKFKEG